VGLDQIKKKAANAAAAAEDVPTPNSSSTYSTLQFLITELNRS
jgi:hypothetical protein